MALRYLLIAKADADRDVITAGIQKAEASVVVIGTDIDLMVIMIKLAIRKQMNIFFLKFLGTSKNPAVLYAML